MTREKITQALEKPPSMWGVIKMLIGIIGLILSAVWAHGASTYATRDAVAANQREIKVIREDVRGLESRVRQDIKDFRIEQRQVTREIKNLLLPEPPR